MYLTDYFIFSFFLNQNWTRLKGFLVSFCLWCLTADSADIHLVQLSQPLDLCFPRCRLVSDVCVSFAEAVMERVAANQRAARLRWEIITLPSVALFHSHLVPDLHPTMDPADVKVPVSFLRLLPPQRLGTWTPSRSSSFVPEIDSSLFNYSRCWIMWFSVCIGLVPPADPNRWGWAMPESMAGGRTSIRRRSVLSLDV